ncbi:MAG: helix-turn-helix domain-containing protein [Rikenellaceae bacterium]|nr:helix-turn-helix domain-containing protein [Rikenellaceae bacterium]
MDSSIRTFGFKKGLPYGFEIKELSDVKRSPGLFAYPKRAEFYQLIIAEEGVTDIIIDFNRITLKKRDAVLISSGQVYGFDADTDCNGTMLLFTDSFFSVSEQEASFLFDSEILNPSSLNKIVNFDEDFYYRIMPLMCKEYSRNPDLLQTAVIHNLLEILLFTAERIISEKTELKSYSCDCVSRKFSNLVEAEFTERRSVKFYAGKFGVSEKILNATVYRKTGRTPKEYISNRIILEAKRLLCHTTISAKEISYTLGFDEPTNFNKFFRKYTGLSPIEFRERNAGGFLP